MISLEDIPSLSLSKELSQSDSGELGSCFPPKMYTESPSAQLVCPCLSELNKGSSVHWFIQRSNLKVKFELCSFPSSNPPVTIAHRFRKLHIEYDRQFSYMIGLCFSML